MMSIERIRRGIEFDAYQALRALPKGFDGNPSDYDVGDVAAIGFEKLRYMCSDADPDELYAQIEALADSIIEFTSEIVDGEKYYLHRGGMANEIRSRIEMIREGRRVHSPR